MGLKCRWPLDVHYEMFIEILDISFLEEVPAEYLDIWMTSEMGNSKKFCSKNTIVV